MICPLQFLIPNKVLDLIHVDDVVAHWLAELTSRAARPGHSPRSDAGLYGDAGPAGRPDPRFPANSADAAYTRLNDEFTRKLHGTYLSYLEADDFAYTLDKKCDPRGCLAEFVKSAPFGQIFVSRTLPGVTRGNHYHHTKTEKFLVLQGRGADPLPAPAERRGASNTRCVGKTSGWWTSRPVTPIPSRMSAQTNW